MKLLRGLFAKSSLSQGSVATIGNFDGVHRGHQSLVVQLKAKAKEFDLPSVVILFEPQPLEYFSASTAPARIMRFREKYKCLESLGIDYLLCLPFNKNLAGLSAREFVERVLIDHLHIKYLIVGDDFTFGRDRGGNFDFLENQGKEEGFGVNDTPTLLINDQRVSSTAIRKQLAASDFEGAEEFLGRPFEFSGKVCYGQQLGREWGVPTLNIPIARKRTPIHGIFVVETVLQGDSKIYQGVSSLGTRPTVNGKGVLLEVHLFDFNKTVYGSYVRVRPLAKIRDEVKFDSVEELKDKIYEDIEIAKEYFRKTKSLNT